MEITGGSNGNPPAVEATLHTLGAFWTTAEWTQYPIKNFRMNDPGHGFSFEAWRQGSQSTKVRRLEIGLRRIYLERDFAESFPCLLWLGIESSQNTVLIETKLTGDCDISIYCDVSNILHRNNDPQNPSQQILQLW